MRKRAARKEAKQRNVRRTASSPGPPDGWPGAHRVMTTKKMILWVALVVVAFGVGFALGVALWEPNTGPAGEPGQSAS